MFENSGLPPEEFIREVLERHYGAKMTIKDIAVYYNVPMAVIVRIVDMYEPNKERGMYVRKSANSELNDEARKSNEKITDEDIKDLEIDLKLFEKGKTDEGTQEEGDR